MTRRSLFLAALVVALMVFVPNLGTAHSSPSIITCQATAKKPYQPAGSIFVRFTGTFTCSAPVDRIDVGVYAYSDGNLIDSIGQTCYGVATCSISLDHLKQWGCHNYQGQGVGQAINEGIADNGWSSIWQGCRAS